MSRIRSDNLNYLARKILSIHSEVTVRLLAAAAEMDSSNESDRKAIQRVFSSLVKEGVVRPEGEARARRYVPIESYGSAFVREDPPIYNSNSGPEWIISESSRELMAYLSKPLNERKEVSYNFRFLNSYKPNKSYYLSKQQRDTLRDIGTVGILPMPAGTYARKIFERLLIDLAWNSSRLEGNTYSLLETKYLLENGHVVAGREAVETQMILNHKGAIEYVTDIAAEKSITPLIIKSVHALLSDNLLGDPKSSGRLRQIPVGIGRSRYSPLHNPHLIGEYFQVFVGKLNQISDPFEKSFFSLVHIAYLQAFEDVNKRTSRLVANIPLIRDNLKPLSFVDVDARAYANSMLGVYEMNDVSLLRDLYMWAYPRSAQRYSAVQQSMGEPNLLRLKYRDEIYEIVRTVVIEKIGHADVLGALHKMIRENNIIDVDSAAVLQLIETEISSLHEANVARFRITPRQFAEWEEVVSKRS